MENQDNQPFILKVHLKKHKYFYIAIGFTFFYVFALFLYVVLNFDPGDSYYSYKPNYHSPQKLSNNNPSLTGQIKQETVDELLEKIGDKYDTSPSYYACTSIALKQCVYHSINEVAVSKDDIKVCDEFGNKEMIDKCQTMVVINKATSSQDFTQCDRLGNNRKYCIAHTAIEFATRDKDLKFCQLIQDYGLRKIGGADITKEDENYVLTMKQNCINEISFQLAAINKDIKYCAKISDTDYKKKCVLNIKSNN